MNETLLVGYSQDAARKAREGYKALLGAVLIVEAAAGLSLILWPSTVSRILELPAEGAGTLRLAGVLLIVLAGLLATGQPQPSRSKLLNLGGLAARLAFAVALAIVGGRLIWAGAFELLAALGLAQLYFKYFEAEVMSRP